MTKYKGYELTETKTIRFPKDDHETLKKIIDKADENKRKLNNHLIHAATQ